MGKRQWLQTLINRYLSAIQELSDTPEGREKGQRWADWMKEQWAGHGLATLKQQRTLMTEVRNAIKQQLGPEHFALESMNFTKEEWTLMNEEISDRVANRNENQQLLDNPAAIVEKAESLLFSREWSDVAAGLAVLTGRRCSEIMCTAQFEYKSQFSVLFTGALKRRGELQTLTFEIPTLAPAQRVIDALGKLRKWIPAENLDAASVNQKYSGAIVRACDRAFSDLVPQREGRDNLYTHLFRSVYARIATHWYAPPQVADVEYMAAIQGHYAILDETNPTLRRSLAASRHYNDYRIGDGQGNIDGRQGIKLGQPEVEIIDVFKPKMTEAELMEAKPQKHKISSLRLYKDERDRWLALLDRVTSEGTQPEKMSQLLVWAEDNYGKAEAPKQSEEPQEQVEMEPVAEAIPEQAQPQPSAPSSAMDQAWEKIGTLVEAITRLTERMEGAAIPQPPVAPSRFYSPRPPQPNTNGAATSTREELRPVPRQEVRPGRSSADAEEKVNYAIDEIIKHNSQPDLPREQMWEITLSILKQVTKSYQGVIQRVVEQRSHEIEAHHQQLGLGKYHNNVHRRTGAKITDVVQFG